MTLKKSLLLLSNNDENITFEDDDPACYQSFVVRQTITPLHYPSTFAALHSTPVVDCLTPSIETETVGIDPTAMSTE